MANSLRDRLIFDCSFWQRARCHIPELIDCLRRRLQERRCGEEQFLMVRSLQRQIRLAVEVRLEDVDWLDGDYIAIIEAHIHETDHAVDLERAGVWELLLQP